MVPELERVVNRCLEKHPEQRFQSAGDLAFSLRGLAAASGAGAPEVAPLPGSPADRRPSIAVLPFDNLSADEEQEYFCDGVAEEIINALAHLDGLRVVARTSSFVFKDRQEDIRTIGSSLDVEHLLEGSVRKAGNRLRITAQLIKVSDSSHLWSERFDRQLEDVFAIQDEIALAVVDSLELRLLGKERAAIVRRSTHNLDAYSAYLKGKYHWAKLTPSSYESSRSCYEEAIRIDPGFASAYVGLAVWYLSQSFWADLHPQDGIARSIPLLARAAALDYADGEHAAFLGCYQAFFERDRTAADRSFRRGVELGPNVAMCHVNYALFLLIVGSYEHAIAEARTAQRLDPLSPIMNSWTSLWLAMAGRYDEGLANLERLMAMDPSHWMPHHDLSYLYARGSRHDEAIREGEKAVELSGGATPAVMQHAYICYLAGERDRGDELFAELRDRAGAQYLAPTFLALVHLARGEADDVLEHLQEAARIHDPWFIYTRLVVRDLLPAEPRVVALIDELGV